ncbi:3-oxoacyl-[acyl-carrier-protein] synthase III C-terminal domain-containing protein [Moraxella oblonga]|uniref:3-oxoacyl-[acyl-carrier-protein] synthase III C-terminal domain-containing protein n=1 Tax=Moraxella oblonga TaxID=200413 RepID=UPI00082DE4DB|nr:3-oxoacyl-[acyl-carrier-protein] synthase III C-terminal domain-containing protein [Moraxella oblonga]
MTPFSLKLIATGKALPTQKVSSDELDKRLNKPAGYVQKRSGIIYRHHADLHLTQAGLAGQAILNACQNANLSLSDIDLLIAVNGVPQQALPSTASHIFAHLNWQGAGYDVNASCVGFLPALEQAGALLNMGCYKRIAICASDLASRGLNWQDDETALIFGDGAACVILEKGTDNDGGLLGFLMKSYPDGIEYCQIQAGGTAKNPKTGMCEDDFYFKMDGYGVFKKTSEVLPAFLDNLLNTPKNPLTIQKIDLWLVHQASHLGMSHLIKRLGIAPQKVINIYPTHGNQVSASLPTVLHEAVSTGQWQQGKTVALVGTGAGLTLAGAIWQI